MATRTLKTGSPAIIKATGIPGIISSVDHGRYEVNGNNYTAGEITAVKIKPEVKKRIRINHTSDQRQKLNAIYSILSKEIKATPAVCEGWGKIEGCTKKATQIHHKRGRRGLLLIMSFYFCRICGNCHNYINEHSASGVELGLSMLINSNYKIVFTKREIGLLERYKIPYSY